MGCHRRWSNVIESHGVGGLSSFAATLRRCGKRKMGEVEVCG
jgi:hypothetical protein